MKLSFVCDYCAMQPQASLYMENAEKHLHELRNPHAFPQFLLKPDNMREQCSAPPNQMGGGESDSSACVLRSTLLHHSQSDTEDPLCHHHHHAAWSQETLFQKGRLIFSLTIREWLKNRHQTGLIKNRKGCLNVWLLWSFYIHSHRDHLSLFHMTKLSLLNFTSCSHKYLKPTTGPSFIPKQSMWLVLFFCISNNEARQF